MQQLVELERLGDEVGGALLDRFDGFLHGAVAGDDDRDDVRIALERGVEHLPAVDAGQPQVGDEDVEGEIGEPLRAPASRFGLFDDEAVIGEALGDGLAKRVSSSTISRCFWPSGIQRRGRYFDTRRERVNAVASGD